MENRFNLIDEPWIPVAGHGRVSLRDVFSHTNYQSLGGNPIQKIAVFKLLLAIAQAAATPANEQEWEELGAQGLAEQCLSYLDKWHERFFLYGDKPFLQMPAILNVVNEKAEKRSEAVKKEVIRSGSPKPFGAGFYPDLASENNTHLSHTLLARELLDSDKALFILTLMNFSFAGKRVEGDLVSLAGEKLGNRHTAKAGPSLGGGAGYLHSYVMTDQILTSVWLNLATTEVISQLGAWSSGLGIPAWEKMPASEACSYAQKYKSSYMATLVALSRFVLVYPNGIYYLEGLSYPNVNNGWSELSLSLDRSGKSIRAKNSDPEKRPWRELQGLLSFVSVDQTLGLDCYGVKMAIHRSRNNFPHIFIWSAGLRTSSSMGDQSVKQGDDFVESNICLESSVLEKNWFEQLKIEMDELNVLAKTLYGCVIAYFKEFTADKKKEPILAKNMAAAATNIFWQLCERDFQLLVSNCGMSTKELRQRQDIRRKFAEYQHQSYDFFCANETARQIDAWASNRPNHHKYINQEVS